jgi:hypothetical protein
MIYFDRDLSQKLERTEGQANVDFVETHAAISPESGAAWIEVGGAYAMFDGTDSPLTQTFGLGVFENATDDQLDKIESFYRERSSPVMHEVSSMADLSILPLLTRRGYKPIELTSVMILDLQNYNIWPQLNPAIIARQIDPSEADLWAEVAASGWSTEHESLAEFILAFGKIAARTRGGHPFLAWLDERPIAAGGFQIYDEVCILAGASTIPDFRRMGAQNALLTSRLRFAQGKGCSLAMICAQPGSQSQKNAQKSGFQIAYTRIKWQLGL